MATSSWSAKKAAARAPAGTICSRARAPRGRRRSSSARRSQPRTTSSARASRCRRAARRSRPAPSWTSRARRASTARRITRRRKPARHTCFQCDRARRDIVVAMARNLACVIALALAASVVACQRRAPRSSSGSRPICARRADFDDIFAPRRARSRRRHRGQRSELERERIRRRAGESAGVVRDLFERQRHQPERHVVGDAREPDGRQSERRAQSRRAGETQFYRMGSHLRMRADDVLGRADVHLRPLRRRADRASPADLRARARHRAQLQRDGIDYIDTGTGSSMPYTADASGSVPPTCARQGDSACSPMRAAARDAGNGDGGVRYGLIDYAKASNTGSNANSGGATADRLTTAARSWSARYGESSNGSGVNDNRRARRHLRWQRRRAAYVFVVGGQR